MPLEVDLTDEALGEIDVAFDWYLDRSVGAAESFVAEVERSLAVIAAAPHLWPEFEGARRYVLRRFPFSLVYHVDDDSVIVLAVAHQSSGPATGGSVEIAAQPNGFNGREPPLRFGSRR